MQSGETSDLHGHSESFLFLIEIT